MQAATVFDSSTIPPISIEKYLMRLSATFRCCDATFILALVVADRLLQHDGGHLPLTNRNVHRLFLASLVVAVKYHEDEVYKNSHYAKAGGVLLREVNRLERVVLVALDFDLRVAPEQYRLYEAYLAASAGPLRQSFMCAPGEADSGAASGLHVVPAPSRRSTATTLALTVATPLARPPPPRPAGATEDPSEGHQRPYAVGGAAVAGPASCMAGGRRSKATRGPQGAGRWHRHR